MRLRRREDVRSSQLTVRWDSIDCQNGHLRQEFLPEIIAKEQRARRTKNRKSWRGEEEVVGHYNKVSSRCCDKQGTWRKWLWRRSPTQVQDWSRMCANSVKMSKYIWNDLFLKFSSNERTLIWCPTQGSRPAQHFLRYWMRSMDCSDQQQHCFYLFISVKFLALFA